MYLDSVSPEVGEQMTLMVLTGVVSLSLQSIVEPRMPNRLEKQALFGSNWSIGFPLVPEEHYSMTMHHSLQTSQHQREMGACPQVVQDST